MASAMAGGGAGSVGAGVVTEVVCAIGRSVTSVFSSSARSGLVSLALAMSLLRAEGTCVGVGVLLTKAHEATAPPMRPTARSVLPTEAQGDFWMALRRARHSAERSVAQVWQKLSFPRRGICEAGTLRQQRPQFRERSTLGDALSFMGDSVRDRTEKEQSRYPAQEICANEMSQIEGLVVAAGFEPALAAFSTPCLCQVGLRDHKRE